MTIDAINTEAFGPTAESMHFSQAVKSNGLLFCSGVIGLDPSGKVPADIKDEFRAAFRGVGEVLELAGIGFSDIVEATTYHVDLATTISAFMQVRDEFLSPPWSAWTAIGTTGLAVPGAHVEIKVVAQLR